MRASLRKKLLASVNFCLHDCLYRSHRIPRYA